MIKQPGTSPTAISRFARQFAALDLCPIIFDAGQAADRVTFEFRDNVSFVHGSGVWSDALWQRIVHDCRPKLLLSIDGAAERLGIRTARGVAKVSLSAAGLHDPTGIGAVLSDELGQLAATPRTAAPGTLIDDMAMHLPNGQARIASARGGQGVVVILNDGSQLPGVLHLIRRTPDQRFTVIGDVVSFGPEPNVRYLDRRAKNDWNAELEQASVLVQFDRGPANLCLGAHLAHDRGMRVIATSPFAEAPGYSERFFRPADPADNESWVAALRLACRHETAMVASR